MKPYPPRLALATCVHNEESLIGPFLRFHRAMGVARAYVYLDRCTDRTQGIVAGADWVEAVPLEPETAPAVYNEGRQKKCGNDALRRAELEGMDWLLFLDADEFASGGTDAEGKGIQRLDAMLSGVLPETNLVILPVWECVPVWAEAPGLLRQVWFQKSLSTTRRLRHPSGGEEQAWRGWLGHALGKALVRTGLGARMLNPHAWELDSGENLPAEIRGRLRHLVFTDFPHWKAKYEKLAFEPDHWPDGRRVEPPKQLWKQAVRQLSGPELEAYARESVFASEEEIREWERGGNIVRDETLREVLEPAGA
jgi:hypothetical protein